jgi:hypothetical protein
MNVIIDKLILETTWIEDKEPFSFSKKTLTGSFSISMRVSPRG